jgi:hypothetical protein
MRAGWLSGVAILAIALVGCSDSQSKHFSDAKIIDKLNLTESTDNKDAYALDADPFCEIEKKLLNDADEVSAAGDHNNLVIASREGNVGVKAIPVFPVDCKEKVQKKLDKLDPKPKDNS